MEILDPPGLGLIPQWTWLAATWFGSGLVVPLRAGLAVFALLPLLLIASHAPRAVLPLVALLVFAIGVHVGNVIELATGVKDDRRIVIDEVGAFLVGATFIRFTGWRAGLAVLLPYATVFLFLDKLKPWPVSVVEGLPGGWGVMADDLPPALAFALIVVLFSWWRRRAARQ
ncbi:phosphatidylglycerophosphatase A family protein [Peteryoungia ipomoeae]|uniref:Phosphatidylglycerophosphatase A n=1 Tax=Peteryoungia ipomoeae TaxID=1210932 RepID=A0A4S8NYX6_9HYPH|nr:phosphatidylglycerophosphatase A [Peteryoungia ipomoeae]THV22923.1 phosphatidylglycerophosphatase A [Peteryoungia ipomoeae]